ncbi:hypothetical protein L3X38_011970 [Prunus dulcis]|uniref:Uncharacterized protein n=1 Tax=Prunus dulcis TaxID=3755 RepID=A0AAD4ZG70_PRUDU|nr:hypothetical protein L3X38_011970 [Prunus dulcis]
MERGRCALYVHTRIYLARGLLGAHWLRSCENSEVKRVEGWSNPRMGDHPGKLFQPVRGVTIWYQSHSAVWCECADEDVGSLKGVDCEIPHRPMERGRCALYVHTRIYLARGLLGAHWLRSCENSEVKRVEGWSNPRMGDHPGKLFRELPETKPCGPRPKADNIALRQSRSGV